MKYIENLKSKQWFLAAIVRAIKTSAQTAVGLIGTNVVISDVSWKITLSASVLAGLASLLMSLAGLPEVTVEE